MAEKDPNNPVPKEVINFQLECERQLSKLKDDKAHNIYLFQIPSFRYMANLHFAKVESVLGKKYAIYKKAMQKSIMIINKLLTPKK